MNQKAWNPREDCSWCFGKGFEILIAEVGAPKIECRVCLGTGKIPSLHDIVDMSGRSP